MISLLKTGAMPHMYPEEDRKKVFCLLSLPFQKWALLELDPTATKEELILETDIVVILAQINTT